MADIAQIFRECPADAAALEQAEQLPDPPLRYLIAMTPRSGSSYFCDLAAGTGRLGQPGEYLNQDFLPDILRAIPARDADEYLRNLLRLRNSQQRVAGLKASWYQFGNFVNALRQPALLGAFRFVYLTRRDLAAQAVSLYLATASNVFHTNIEHGAEALAKLQALPYSYQEIAAWHKHIVEQEKGWERFFNRNRVFPLHLTYEQIEEDAAGMLLRLAAYLGLDPAQIRLPQQASVFRKLGDARNAEWALRFAADQLAARSRNAA